MYFPCMKYFMHETCMEHARKYKMCVTDTVWRVIFVGANFRGKSDKALRINFRGFKFCDSNPVQGRGTA